MLYARRQSSSDILEGNYAQYTKQQMIAARSAGPLLRDFMTVSDEIGGFCEIL
jgi:hypothetical protein